MSFYIQTSSGGGISIVSGNMGNERSNFGKETVPEIDCSGSVRLNGTTVTGKVDAGGSVTATGATAEEIDAGGSVTATSTICSGKIDAGGSITATSTQATALDAGGSITVIGSTISNKVSAGGSVTANRCEQLGAVKAGGSVDLDECPSVRSVSAGSQVTLRQTKVQGNVSAGGDATVDGAKVGGILTCASNRLVIENSEIDTIDLRLSGGIVVRSGGISIGRGGISMGSMFIGSGSFSIGNISGNPDNIIINGVPLSRLQAKQALSTEEEKQGAKPAQTLILRNSKVKNVIFEGGNGEVVLSGDSQVTGDITGGKIKD